MFNFVPQKQNECLILSLKGGGGYVKNGVVIPSKAFFLATLPALKIYTTYIMKTPAHGRFLKTFPDAVWRTRHRPETRAKK